MKLQMEGIGLILELPDELKKVSMKADKYKIEQVLRNYLTNAVKFSKRGDTITISGIYNSDPETPEKGTLTVAVRDTGAGISPANLKKLFHQYVQIDAARLQRGKGSGLGLWLSKAIVEMHGGRVSATSPGEGLGSCFSFTIPAELNNMKRLTRNSISRESRISNSHSNSNQDLEEVEATAFDATSPILMEAIKDTSTMAMTTESGPSSPPSTSNTMFRRFVSSTALNVDDIDFLDKEMAQERNNVVRTQISRLHRTFSNRGFSKSDKIHVLIADDSTIARKLLARQLQTLNAACTHSSNGLEAVQKVQESMDPNATQFSVVIIDNYMPGLDGPEAIEKIRQAGYKGLVIALTATSAPKDRMKLTAAGADHIMSKPFDLQAFVEILSGTTEEHFDVFFNRRLTRS